VPPQSPAGADDIVRVIATRGMRPIIALLAAGIATLVAVYVFGLSGCTRRAGQSRGPATARRAVTENAAGGPKATGGSDIMVQYGYGMSYRAGRLVLPPDSWVLSGSKDKQLVADIVAAVRSARRLDPPMGLLDFELLYLRDEHGRGFTVSLTVDQRKRTVFLGQGFRESRQLYTLLRRAEHESGGVKPQPWPDDARTVPHNQW
jgi:hypothetical protein